GELHPSASRNDERECSERRAPLAGMSARVSYRPESSASITTSTTPERFPVEDRGAPALGQACGGDAGGDLGREQAELGGGAEHELAAPEARVSGAHAAGQQLARGAAGGGGGAPRRAPGGGPGARRRHPAGPRPGPRPRPPRPRGPPARGGATAARRH